VTQTNPYWPTATPDSIGPIIGADDVRDAVNTVIATWAPYYLGVLSAKLVAAGKLQAGTHLPAFGKWVDEPDFRSLGTGQPAACLVTSPGTVGQPVLQASGLYIATWRVQVAVQVFGTDWQQAADRTSWYEKAVRLSVLQNRSLGGFANATLWAGSAYERRWHEQTRTEGVATLGFDVEVFDVTSVLGGPDVVPDNFDVPPSNPTALTADVELVRDPTPGP
jgi:hypothetical protein